MVPKLFTCLKDYNKDQFLQDLSAGLIVAIIALPLSIALAMASGVSPDQGIITAVVGGFLISLLGGSRVQIGGPTGAFVIIVYGIVKNYGIEGLTIATMIAGIVLIMMGILGLGNMIKFIPYPITTGFTSGIAVTIFSSQIKDFLGLDIKDLPDSFIDKWDIYFHNLYNTNIEAFLIGSLSIAIMILWPKWNKSMPATLVAILVSTMLAFYCNINVPTIESQFGQIRSTLPNPHIPIIDLNTIKNLILPGITIALLGSIESLLSAVVADGMIGGKHRSNIELMGQGVANIGSALFGGIPVTGAIARTAANIKNGGKTPVAGIMHSISLLIMMMVLMPYVKFVPLTCLAAILMMVAYHMGEWGEFLECRKSPKSDATVFLVVFFLTVLTNLIIAIEVGMVLASFLFMKRMAEVTHFKYFKEDRMEEDIHDHKKLGDIAFYEINGPFFFGAADKFIQVLKNIKEPPKVLILKMRNVSVIDATAYSALKKFYHINQKSGTKLIIAELQPLPFKILNNYGFIELIGKQQICDHVDEAIEKANKVLYEQSISPKDSLIFTT